MFEAVINLINQLLVQT